jgi:hypothetical protein
MKERDSPISKSEQSGQFEATSDAKAMPEHNRYAVKQKRGRILLNLNKVNYFDGLPKRR